MSASPTNLAAEIQARHAFYLVALVFTILGLSIQTANFDGNKVADACELIAWVSLLISGLAGLRRIEIIPRIHQLGSLAPPSEESKKLLDEGMEKKQAVALFWWKLHKRLLVAGLISLVIARGLEPAIGLFK